MSVIRVNANVPESRKVTVTLTLPEAVPVGDAELEIVVREPSRTAEFTVPLPDDRPRAFPTRPTNPALGLEFDAFEFKLPELMARHAGQYVALRDGAVVAVGDTEVDALTAAHQQRPGQPVFVRLVTDQPEVLPRVGSPRGVSALGIVMPDLDRYP